MIHTSYGYWKKNQYQDIEVTEISKYQFKEELPDFLVNESANNKQWTDSSLIFSKLDILELLLLENELSNLSAGKNQDRNG